MVLGGLAALALLAAGSANVLAQTKGKPAPPTTQSSPASDQVIAGYPLTITVEDSTQMKIQYTNPALDQDMTYQFYGEDAEGVYVWVNVGGTTQVFGPEHVPAGDTVNPYTPVSNTKTGSGTPSDPWIVTTVNSVPGTSLRLTQKTNYVNGAEFVGLTFSLEQIGGSAPITATLFHAADLFTGDSDQGFGFYDADSGAVGDYYTTTVGVPLYQTFVPANPATAYMESYYNTIWSNIGSTSGPGAGFNNTIISDTLHDSGAGLQWDLTVPQSGPVSVGDTDLFSVHSQLCGNFSDVHYGDYFYEGVHYLACNNIVNGYSDTTFRPYNNASRGQLSKMVVLSEGWTIDTSGGPHFADVAQGSTFYDYIETAYHHSIISGYPCGGIGEPCGPGNLPYFRPASNVTRGQAMKIVVGGRGWTIDVTGGPHFTDVPQGSTFYDYIETAFNKGIINGYGNGTFGPGDNILRGQMSKVLYLALQIP
jgi:hypothetical protein